MRTFLSRITPLTPETPCFRCRLSTLIVSLIALLGMTGTMRAGTLSVPNFSFESQVTPFADPRVDSWQKPPQPGTFDTNVFGPWENLAGVFVNAPATNADHIDNCNGNQ